MSSALRLDPGNALLIGMLASILGREGKSGQAESEYRSALRLKPTVPAFRYGFGKWMQQQTRTVEATDQFD